MNLPLPVAKPDYHDHQREVLSSAKAVAERSMKEAAVEVSTLNRERNQLEQVCPVTFNGTWMRRGFSLLHGVFT